MIKAYLTCFFQSSLYTGEGVIRAETLTKMFFESDYEGLQAEHVKSALEGDPRLVLLNPQEIQETPVTKLAAKYGLVASNCSSFHFNQDLL